MGSPLQRNKPQRLCFNLSVFLKLVQNSLT